MLQLYIESTPSHQRLPIQEWLEIVGSTQIQLDSLDDCLSGRPDLSPDFLKIDVEGADLEVLRGGHEALSGAFWLCEWKSVSLSVMSDPPFFGETDAFLRAHGFMLSHLSNDAGFDATCSMGLLRNHNSFGATLFMSYPWNTCSSVWQPCRLRNVSKYL